MEMYKRFSVIRIVLILFFNLSQGIVNQSMKNIKSNTETG